MGDSFFLVQATLPYYLLQLKCPTSKIVLLGLGAHTWRRILAFQTYLLGTSVFLGSHPDL